MLDTEIQDPHRIKARRVRLWPFRPAPIYDTGLLPVKFQQIILQPGGSTKLEKINGPGDRFYINVEIGSIRYIDDGQEPMAGFGELWSAGSGFFRVVDPSIAWIANEGNTTAQVNVSIYASAA